MKTVDNLALAAAAAALLSGCMTMGADDGMSKKAEAMADVAGKCHGINSCKGHSACATANSACKGQNACKGQGWTPTSKADCEANGGDFEA